MNQEYKQFSKVQRVIGHRNANGFTEFLVKWAALPYCECSWESEIDLHDTDAVARYHTLLQERGATTAEPVVAPAPVGGPIEVSKTFRQEAAWARQGMAVEVAAELDIGDVNYVGSWLGAKLLQLADNVLVELTTKFDNDGDEDDVSTPVAALPAAAAADAAAAAADAEGVPPEGGRRRPDPPPRRMVGGERGGGAAEGRTSRRSEGTGRAS